MEDEIKARAKENQLSGLKQGGVDAVTQKSAEREKVGETRKELAKLAGLSVKPTSELSKILTLETSQAQVCQHWQRCKNLYLTHRNSASAIRDEERNFTRKFYRTIYHSRKIGHETTKGKIMKQLKDKKIEILGVIDTSQPGDMPTESWAPIHTGTLWAYVRQLSAKEYYAASAVQAGEEMLFIINWRDDVKSTTNMIRYKDKYYNIKRIDTYEGYRQDLKIYADSGTDQEPTV